MVYFRLKNSTIYHKAIIIVFFAFLAANSLPVCGQDIKAAEHRLGQSILSASPTLLLNTPHGVQFAGGIKYQLFLGKRFSLDADFVLGRNYVHFGPGVIGLPLLLLADESEQSIRDFLISLVAIALSFEHFSYHIPVNPSMDVSPFVSLLRFKSSYSDNSLSDPDFVSDQLSFALGVQANKYFGRFVLAPYGEYNIGYKDSYSRFNFGIYFGFMFSGKRIREVF